MPPAVNLGGSKISNRCHRRPSVYGELCFHQGRYDQSAYKACSSATHPNMVLDIVKSEEQARRSKLLNAIDCIEIRGNLTVAYKVAIKTSMYKMSRSRGYFASPISTFHHAGALQMCEIMARLRMPWADNGTLDSLRMRSWWRKKLACWHSLARGHADCSSWAHL